MMKLLGALFFVIAAVVIGLAIAYWYLRRVEDERRRLHREPKVVPIPDKHRPVDVTPASSSLQSPPQETDAAASANDADVDGLMRRLDALKDNLDSSRVADTGHERDDLTRISGVGPALERLLHANGIFRFQQIADWQDVDIDSMDRRLGSFRGRIRRDDWVGQAKRLSE